MPRFAAPPAPARPAGRRVAAGAATLAAALAVALAPAPLGALEPSPVAARLDAALAAAEGDLVAWRRHLHQHPELGNREFETARFVAARLAEMGLAPRTGVAKTGVVAVIEGGRPGPAVALRADLDALPVTEEVDLPFASRATATWEGKTVGVMHACGHDTHVAMLLAAARALVAVRSELPGKVVLLFQPAEESVPIEEQPAGAELMVREGVLDDPRVGAIFGLHVFSQQPSGQIGYRSGPLLAAADRFQIVVRGRQAHGSKPWAAVDPIVVGAEIVGALQTIVARALDLTHEPAVVTVGQFEAGVRNNIIPERARLVGTIRTFDDAMREEVHSRVRRIAEHVAAAHGASVEVTIERGYPVTSNDPELTGRMLPTLERLAPGQVREIAKITGAEDFSFFAHRVPGLYLILGVTPPSEMATAASNHSPRFTVDERTLPLGARALAHLAADWLFAARR
jgi:amidohydrolase